MALPPHSNDEESSRAAAVASETDPLLATHSLPIDEEQAENHPLPDEETPSLIRFDSFVQAAAEVTEQVVETVTEVTEQVIEGVQEFAEAAVEKTKEEATNLTENVVEEVIEVKDAVLEELHDADDGELTVLDMSLARNFSILPGELQHAIDMVQHRDEEESRDGSIETKPEDFIELEPIMATVDETSSDIPLSAYFGLASAVIALSSIGPSLEFQKGATSPMKINWRMAGTGILLTPLALIDLRRRGGFPHLTSPQWVTFLLSTAAYVTMCLAFAIAINYTAVGNVVILSNSQSIMLLMGNLLVGSPVTMLEGCGALIAFAGAVLCSKDASDGSEGTSDGNSTVSTLYGDALALLSGLGGCGYLIFAKTSRQHMGLFVFMWLTMLTGSFMILLLQIFILKENVSFDTGRTTGVFGYFSLEADRLPLELFIVVVCNLCGTGGYVRAMQYFDSLVISVAGLMEPVVAELIGFAINVSALPGLTGWIGNLLVTLGTLAVVYPAPSKQGKSSGAH